MLYNINYYRMTNKNSILIQTVAYHIIINCYDTTITIAMIIIQKKTLYHHYNNYFAYDSCQ